MAALSDDEVLDVRTAAVALHRDADPKDLDQEVAPKGLRLLNRVHRLSDDSVRESSSTSVAWLASSGPRCLT